MPGIKEIIEEAESLPVEERVIVIDSLLKSINQPIPEIEAKWIEAAKRRLAELRSGAVEAVPANQVFDKVRVRYDK